MEQAARYGKLSAPETRRVRLVIDELLSTTALQKTVNDLMRRANSPIATTFERYAGIALKAAGAASLENVAPLHALHILPPGNGKLARIVCAAKLSDDEQSVIGNVESVINRLLCICDAIEDSFNAFATAEGGPRISISLLGNAFLPDQPGYRTSFVELPPMGPTEHATLGYFCEVDWRVLDNIASNAHVVFQNSMLPNIRQSIMGAFAHPGSDWDVRTRMAAIFENLELPLRSSYSFDCDTQADTAIVRFAVPSIDAFPTFGANGAASLSALTEQNRLNARKVFTLKMSCLLAAACFGAGRTIKRAFVIPEPGAQARSPECALAFDRHSYVHDTLTAIDDGKLADPSIRYDLTGCLSLAACETVEGDELDAVLEGFQNQRVEVWRDTRPLDKELRKLFRVNRISDIDTQHYHGPRASEIDEARRDVADSRIASIARLESLVDDLEALTYPPNDDASARPLYCNNPYARVVISLADDETAVSLHAEAFIHGEDDSGDETLPRYFRAPSALYHAHMGLSDLYEQLGDLQGAEKQADQCVELAPTTADAHYRKASILAGQGRFVEAANVIASALRFAVSDRDCSLLYYHLGLLLWQLGRKREAAAVYVYTAALGGDYAEKALKIVRGLQKRGDGSIIAHVSPRAAAAEMRRYRIPVAPSELSLELATRAAIGLSCVHAPLAAAPYADMLARHYRDDAILQSTCRSLAQGCIPVSKTK